MTTYDPFARGPFPVGVRTVLMDDAARKRSLPCEIWYPAVARYAGEDLDPATQDSYTVRDAPRRQTAVRDAAPQTGRAPLIVFSHHSGGSRRASTFVCAHLSSHGYIVAAPDHSEVVAPELARREGESAEQRAARMDAWIASRVPDLRFLLDRLLSDSTWNADAARIGAVGHSFGGWTVLAALEVDPRIGCVVAFAPAGNSKPKPDILPLKLTFEWRREVPAMYLAAENDVAIPPAAVQELFERTPGPKQMFTLGRADHIHFIDNVEQEHEFVRSMPFPGANEMLPIADLISGDQAHLFVRGLTLAHMDAHLKQDAAARRFLEEDPQAALQQRGVDAVQYRP